jgi:protein-S-isoprenylcysteine O-methyltransferase Ste14
MAIFVVEALVAFAAAFPSQPFATSWIENLCTAAPSLPEIYGPSTSILELLAVIFIIFGAQLRLRSQRVLGRHFTFELSVLDKHELVTLGPYRYIRHPGYTGFFFFILGLTVYPLARGTLLRECIWHSWNITSTTLYAVQVGLLVSIWYLITTRASIEDAMLRETFGGEWERWAKTTRYKLFPGIL